MSELNDQPFPAPWQSMTTTSVAPAGPGAAHRGVDLLRVELAPLLVEGLAAVDLLPVRDAGDALHVAHDEDPHAGGHSTGRVRFGRSQRARKTWLQTAGRVP